MSASFGLGLFLLFAGGGGGGGGGYWLFLAKRSSLEKNLKA